MAKVELEGPEEGASRRPTIVDLARAAGVSKSTVSLVLNGSELVRPATRERVREAALALGYVYNRSAAGLRHRTNDVVGVVVNDLANPFFAQMMIGVERALRSSGRTPLLASTGDDVGQQGRLLRSVLERGACGFVLSAATGTDADALTELAPWRVPLVAAMRDVPGDPAHVGVVVPDNLGGAREAVRHLVALGHRRIGFLGASEALVVRAERLAGFRAGLAEAGLAPALEIESAVSRTGGAEALGRALDAPAGAAPTALLCFNDLVAIGAVHAAAERGVAVGEALALVGFDDIEEARWTRPPLTTVRVDAARVGEIAVAELSRAIDGARPRRVVCPTSLVVRASCGAPPRPSSAV